MQMVQQEYDELYGGDVNVVHLVYQSKDLDPLVEEYKGILRSLEDLVDDYASKMQRDKNVKRQSVSPLSISLGQLIKSRQPF